MKKATRSCLATAAASPRVSAGRFFVPFGGGGGRGGNSFRTVAALLLGFVLVAELSAGSAQRRNREIDDRRCSEVNRILESKVADIESDEGGPDVCSPSSGSAVCCSNRMEQQLLRHSGAQVYKTLTAKMKILKQTFDTWSSKFDSLFIGLIERSKRQLHDTFSMDHPVIFQGAGDILIQLCHDLASYYKSSDLNFNEALDRFFSSLFQRLFVLFNKRYAIGQDFLDCLIEHMEPLQPFGSVHARLAWQASLTVVAARTFVKGLSEGKATIVTAMKQSLDDRCLNGMTRTLYCPLCRGLPSANPCFDHCVRTASNCPRLQMELKNDWNAYTNTLMLAAKSFSSNFSIEGVVGRIDSIVSEAVDIFLQNENNIRESAFSMCGTPSLVGRRRRETEPDEETATAASQSFHYANSSSSSSAAASFLSPSTINETTTAGQTVIHEQRRLEGGEEEEERQSERLPNDGRDRHRQKPRRERQRQQQTERVTRPIRHRTNKTQEQEQRGGGGEQGEEEEKEEEKEEEEEEEEEEHRRAEGEREELRHRAEEESERRQKKKRPSKKEEQRRRQTPQPPTQTPLSPLQTLAAHFMRKFDVARGLWAGLPQWMCETLDAERNNRTCWNGVQLTSGEADAGTHRGGGEETPDGATSSVAKKESLRLRNTAASLRDALRGLGELPDIDDWGSGGMEFGSGSSPDRSPFVTRASPPLYLGPSKTSNSMRSGPPSSSSHSATATFCCVIVSSVAAILVLPTVLGVVFH